MEKLKLTPEELRVDSFPVQDLETELRRTVEAYVTTLPYTCPGMPTDARQAHLSLSAPADTKTQRKTPRPLLCVSVSLREASSGRLRALAEDG